VTNLVLNLALIRVLGFRGLALGTALAALGNAGLLLWLLRGRLQGLEGRRIAVALIKITMASAAMGAGGYYSHAWLASALPGRGLFQQLVQVFGAIGVAVVVLGASARILRIAEFDEALRRVMRRLRPAPAGGL